MNLADRAGELLVIGFHGTHLPPETADFIAGADPSGIILFARNLDTARQTRELTATLQAAGGGPLPRLICIDQEGGVVARTSTRSVGGTPFPGNMALGATRSPELAYAAARATAEELLALGINCNLAPVLDVQGNSANPVVGSRSYGSDPALAAALGAAAVRGYQDGGILACGKHFPGHGDTAVDSHLDLPVIAHGRDRLDAVELVPFRAAIGAGVAATMTAHVVFPAIEPEPGRAATLSRRVLTGLLREELGFGGLIITDCLEMQAVARHPGVPRAAVLAVAAGADLVLVSHTPELQQAALAALREAIAAGEIPAAQVAAALDRIAAARRRPGAARRPPLAAVGCPEHRALAERIAAAAVTVVRDNPPLLPLPVDGLGAVVCRPGALSPADDRIGAGPLLAQAVRRWAPGAEVLVVDASPAPEQVAAAAGLAERCRSVIAGTFAAHRHRGQDTLVRAVLAANPRTVLIAQRSPYDLQLFPEAGTCLATYEDRPPVLEAAVRAVLGLQAVTGGLPVTL